MKLSLSLSFTNISITNTFKLILNGLGQLVGLWWQIIRLSPPGKRLFADLQISKSPMGPTKKSGEAL